MNESTRSRPVSPPRLERTSVVRARSGPSRPEVGDQTAQGRAEALIGRVFLGQYEVQKLMASGSMGHVFLGKQLKLERPVAIKLITGASGSDSRFLKRFSREASLSAQLAHPNIVSIYDYGESESGDLFLVMEHLSGRSLESLILDGPLPVARALGIAIQVARAVRKAHAAGVVHRDLKPANVMVRTDDEEGETVKVLDFGLAKLFAVERPAELAGAAGDDDPLTRPGSMVGTPNYVSPEQAMGDAVDGRSDVYSLGVVLFEMVAGRLPFRGASIGEVVRQHLRSPVPDVLDVSPDVECPLEVQAIIARAMAKLPQHRFDSMESMLSALKRAYEQVAHAPAPHTLGSGSVEETDFSRADERSTQAGVPALAGLAVAGRSSASSVDTADLDPTLALVPTSTAKALAASSPRSQGSLARTGGRWWLFMLMVSSLGLVLAIFGAMFSAAHRPEASAAGPAGEASVAPRVESSVAAPGPLQEASPVALPTAARRGPGDRGPLNGGARKTAESDAPRTYKDNPF